MGAPSKEELLFHFEEPASILAGRIEADLERRGTPIDVPVDVHLGKRASKCFPTFHIVTEWKSHTRYHTCARHDLTNRQSWIDFRLVNAAEVLRAVRGFARAGRIVYSSHARKEMAEAGARAADVRHALIHAASAKPSNDRWRVVGPDIDGDELIVVVVLENGVVVVTVF